MEKKKLNNTQIYMVNKATKCGDTITCPTCKKEFVKKQYSQAFCCSRCRDSFHNYFGDRHRKGYYAQYNARHPKRLDYLDSIRERYSDDSYAWCENPILGI